MDALRHERSRLAGSMLLALTVFLPAGQARGDERDTGREGRRAAEVFDDGMAALTGGDVRSALRLFQLANTLEPAAGTSWNIVVAEVRLEMHVAARRDVDAYIAGFGPLPPERLNAAIALRERLEAKLARLDIAVDPPGATVLVDDAAPEPGGWLEPGAHVVRVAAPGKRSRELGVSLKPGERLRWEVTLMDTPPSPPLLPRVDPAQRRVGLAFVGLGAGGVVTGAVLGGLALDHKLQMNRVCPDQDCTSDAAAATYRRSQHAAYDLGAGSNLAFVLGATVTGLGALITLTATRREPARTGDLGTAPAGALIPVEGGAIGLFGGTW